MLMLPAVGESDEESTGRFSLRFPEPGLLQHDANPTEEETKAAAANVRARSLRRAREFASGRGGGGGGDGSHQLPP